MPACWVSIVDESMAVDRDAASKQIGIVSNTAFENRPDLGRRMLDRENLKAMLGLKRVDRAGWLSHGLSNVESVAAHSWGVAFLTLMLKPENLDAEKVLKMAILHDLAEVIIGDVTPKDEVPEAEKLILETSAMKNLLQGHPAAAELLELWLECETRSTPEGDFVKQCDKLDMALQAQIYSGALTGFDPSEFLASALQGIDNPALRELAQP